MILCGAKIHRGGHGRCGLVSIRVLSYNIAELPFSAVLANTGMRLSDLVVARCRFKQGGQSLVRL